MGRGICPKSKQNKRVMAMVVLLLFLLPVGPSKEKVGDWGRKREERRRGWRGVSLLARRLRGEW